jgi:hypothetical protein
MDHARIVAIDPGLTTGYVDLQLSFSDASIRIVRAEEVRWERRFELEKLLFGAEEMPPDDWPHVVVVESFRLYAHKAKDQINNDFPSVRVIGTLEAFLNHRQIMNRLVLQPASVTALVAIEPEHARILGASEHMKDAYKHARYYMLHHRA